MSGILSTPKAPVIPPPAPMPTPDSAEMAKAKKKQQAAAMSRTGRQSTIMTNFGQTGGDKLGG
jgi:hypothetical protein